MQDYTPIETQAKDRVNTAIPGPTEPRWVVLVCSFKPLDDPETGEVMGLEFSLDHAVSPETGSPASANDPDTWANRATAYRRQCLLGKQIERGQLGSTWMRMVLTGFVADGELHFSNHNNPPQPIGSERPAQVRF